MAQSPAKPTAIPPIYTFPSIDEFARRHKAGTEAEFAQDDKETYAINKEGLRYQAWVLAEQRRSIKKTTYLILVDPGEEGKKKLPQQGEPAKMRIVFDEGYPTRGWEVHRVTTSSLPHFLEVPNYKRLNAPRTTITVLSNSAYHTHDFRSGGIPLTAENSVNVCFWRFTSEATKDAEIGALRLLYGPHQNATERQIHAFNWFVTLRQPEFGVDLHHYMPHMRQALNDPEWSKTVLGRKFGMLNQQQQDVYRHGFRNIPCGICILPGGPGAGKTHFNLFTVAMAQSQPLPKTAKVDGRYQKTFAKVLFIVDMNNPVDDIANRMLRLNHELGVKKSVIRMKGWGTEVKFSDRLDGAQAGSSEEPMTVDFTNQFVRSFQQAMLGEVDSGRRSCEAPSLDEAAWERFESYRLTKYEELAKCMEEELFECEEVIPLRFRRLVYSLYRDTLAAADFIATTPVAASNHFRGMFRPDLVYFDEAPHARELCNLIAIANFDPLVWVMSGDHRQTRPYVGSAGPTSENLYAPQMSLSMMERAERAGVIQFELLTNHRAFGGLHHLASRLWYQGRMTSGNDGKSPEALVFTRSYLERLMNGRSCTVPRLLVHLKSCPKGQVDGTSSWNIEHFRWVMKRVKDLLMEPKFRHAERGEPGTILIISPYKKAHSEYKEAIQALPRWAQRRVEARTVDVSQGHEADFVFVDLVKEKSTDFLDDPNRLCVALSRARLGEVIMMHPSMPNSLTFKHRSQNLNRIYALCKEAQQHDAKDDVYPDDAPFTISRHNDSHGLEGGTSSLSSEDLARYNGNTLDLLGSILSG
ncbi:P-loop containing nucleoside triphosphate hydrolase protein [Podospora australis]|uniref:P-loop containing nucleoside triphosphate hydrolase protein n=1 Tax=Podospora australis TaxID=1536484 RepID=A0AAN6WL76_9PEZI|nr:P-loop containing nucleoside triphosphate hydrolase protein [Podospora australis]